MRVLFISFYFPPYSVSTPVVRAVEFIKHLSRLGIEPFVLTQKGFVFGKMDYSFEKDIKNIPVYRVKMPEVKREYGKSLPLKTIIRNVLWPDALSLFVARALPLALKLIRDKKIDFIFTFSPPYSSIFLTYLIHKRTGIPYAIDIQDPWKEDLYNLYKNRLQRYITNYYEERILKKARFVTAINMPMVSAYKSTYKVDNVYFLPFGYRKDDVDEIRKPEKGDRLRLLYTGTLGGIYKDAKYLFSAIDLFFSKHYGAKVEFYFVGNKSPEVLRKLSKFPSDEVISIPYVEKKEVPKLVNKAHVLLLLSSEGKNSHLVSTSKVYELLNMKRPLAAFLQEGWLYDLVREYTPFITRWDDKVGIAQIFENLYDLWKRDGLSKYALLPSQEYSYEYLSKKLFDIIINSIH